MLPLWPSVRPRATIFTPHPLMPPPNLGSRRAYPSSPSPRVSTSTALLRWCVVDASDEFQLGVSAASFHLLCTPPALRGKPVLLVWNKLDAPCPLPRVETTEAFELDRARAVLGEGVWTTMDVSALSGLNVEAVMMWMRGVYVSREHARGDA